MLNQKKQSPILQVKNLNMEFATKSNVVKAVDNISFHVNKGETVGIVGESGSGKSVTALSIMRLIHDPGSLESQGEMLFQSPSLGEVDLVQVPKRVIRKIRGNEISMIFQEPMSSLNPVYTCGDQVIEAILLHQKISRKEAREKTLELFAKVQLPRPAYIFKTYP